LTMKERTNPNMASASTNAIPRNIVVRTMPGASGCRAIASTDLPTRKPIPMAGQMAHRPYTRHLRMGVPMFVAAWASRPNRCVMWFLLLVLGVDGPGEVHGGQDGEDVRLQHRDQDLERGDERAERERRDGEGDRRELPLQVPGAQEEDR